MDLGLAALGSSLVSGALSFFGGSNTNATNAKIAAQQMAFQAQQAEINRQFNAEQTKIARDWDYYLSNTAFQRQMSDMRSAGLNPILAAGKGSGAPMLAPGAATSSAMPQGHSWKAENVLGGVAHSAARAGEAANTIMKGRQEVALTEKQVENAAATNGLIEAQTKQAEASTAETNARTITELRRPGHVGAQTERELASAQSALAEASLRRAEEEQLRAHLEKFRNLGSGRFADVGDTAYRLYGHAANLLAGGPGRTYAHGAIADFFRQFARSQRVSSAPNTHFERNPPALHSPSTIWPRGQVGNPMGDHH